MADVDMLAVLYLVIVGLLRPPITSASYLDLPRIHFAGQFRADPNTRNNINCNFDVKYPLSKNISLDYNFNGTGEFSFFQCAVTSVVDEDGVPSLTDPIVNSPIFNNAKKSFPKLVDLDVDYQLIKAAIYGMNFGVKWQEGGGLAFRGDWQLNVIAQDLWTRSICTDVPQDIAESHRIGTKSVTKLKNVKWGHVSKSPILQQLKERAAESGGDLSVSMTIYFYTRDTPSYLFTNFTLGHVVGTIGIAKQDEPMNFNGDRLLSFEGVEQPHLPLSVQDSCYNYQQNQTNHPYWMYKAPFQVYTEDQRLTVDLSNSLPFDLQCSLRDLGDLWLGIMNEKDNCIELIGKKSLQYREDENWLIKTGGVVDYTLTKRQVHLLKTSKLVVARVLTAVIEQWQQDKIKTASAPLNLHLECSSEYTVIEIMLQENPKFIRPLDYYVSRLEYQESFKVRLLVTNYGQPLANETIYVFLSNDPIPQEGVVPTAAEATTDESGIATFFFRVQMKIPPIRMYHHEQPCLPHETKALPIEGQVYMFKYYANGMCIYDVNNTATQLTCVNDVAILAFSYKELPREPYTWVRDVGPIFRQYDHLYPVMHQMVDLANYTAVTLPYNLQLLSYSMGLDTSHPSSMPVTRDLSPTDRKMILKWLDNPIYDTSGESVMPSTPLCIPPPTLAAVDYHENYFHPPRCAAEGLTFGSTPDQDHGYFKDIFHTDVGTFDDQNFPRPLWRSHLNSEFSKSTSQCSVPHLLEQLQQAVELEFATLPVYLTSLYSIVDGCNTEVYELIRSVIMQEMLHMTQAANILIAIGGTPIIDSKNTVPKFPTIGLPGGVLPHLKITLEKASLIHIYRVFMGVEVPHNLSVDDLDSEIFNDTIGQFYQEIESCIEQLGDEIFLGRVDEQVKWPWDAPTVGTVHVVTNVKSAKEGIKEIVEQGEGAGPLDPTEGDLETLAHFYRFEEIVCQHHLVETTEHGEKTYAYTGSPILFDPAGVWPMRDNPSKDCIPPDNNCYTEAKVFHEAYRSLLRKIQEVFSGQPDQIKGAVTNMESLAVHARKLMWTKIRDNDDITCGPVWDYEWDD